MVTAQHEDRCVINVARRTSGLRCAEQGEAHQHAADFLCSSSQPTDKEDQVREQAQQGQRQRIFISYATAMCLGLVKVLWNNKAPKWKRQVASITKEQPKAI